MIRPSYVLGGRTMMVAPDQREARPFIEAAFKTSPGFPVLIEHYLELRIELDVDLQCYDQTMYVGGIMQHTFSLRERTGASNSRIGNAPALGSQPKSKGLADARPCQSERCVREIKRIG